MKQRFVCVVFDEWRGFSRRLPWSTGGSIGQRLVFIELIFIIITINKKLRHVKMSVSSSENGMELNKSLTGVEDVMICRAGLFRLVCCGSSHSRD